MKHGRSLVVYQPKHHFFPTIFLAVAPLIFFLFFSRFANIPVSLLFQDLALSFYRIIIAYFIAAILGWICAVLFHRDKVSAIALPIFDVLQSFPVFAVLPLATYFLGSSNATIIFFLILTIIWPIFFSVISSLKLVRKDWQEAAAIYNLSGISYFTHFIFPVTLPGLITGSIIGIGVGWEALIATEIVIGAKSGLGNFFQSFSDNTTITIFGILGFLFLIFSINQLVWLSLLEWSHRRMEE